MPGLNLPEAFPASDYTPFGYLDNPAHSGVLNPSGIIRTVPPLGMGWWARAMPWPYGMGVERRLSYLSFLRLSVTTGPHSLPPEQRFYTSADFEAAGVTLASRYHTKNLLSYDWASDGLAFSAKYLLPDEHTLICIFEVANTGTERQALTVHASHLYGYPGPMYWGRDGLTSQPSSRVSISKIWAYGDVFALGADREAAAYKATASDEQWDTWVNANDLNNSGGVVVRFHEGGDHLTSMMSYPLEVGAGESDTLVLALVRDVNEPFARQRLDSALGQALEQARALLAADESFYASAPLLTGDWPTHWRHGWVYDFETLRMTVRPPLGIYRHPWDGMQIHTPRAVLGETCLDMLCLSYADMRLAQTVIYGTFADSPVPNIPCTREDGSMNMIGEGGAECGTAPTWGFPSLAILSLYYRSGDVDWVKRLYPYLKAFIEWWLENRTDDDGWFFTDNSWESGQDGSRRFLHEGAQEGTPARFVRTVDIEAALAHAMQIMVELARVSEHTQDVALWQERAEDRTRRTRSMFAEGSFRDFDARANKPFSLDDYEDVMMLFPLAAGIATPEQAEAMRPKFRHFAENPRHWLEWPSFWQPFSEAGWHAGERDLIARELVKVGERIYQRTDAREISPVADRYHDRLPAAFNYRIPGVASEFWPVKLEGILNGAEHYGWGATFPALVIRNLIGFREEADALTLTPTLPDSLFKAGRTYGISNLRWRDLTLDVQYTIAEAGQVVVRLIGRLPAAGRVRVQSASGETIALNEQPERSIELAFTLPPGAGCRITTV